MRSAHTVAQVRDAEAVLLAALPEGTLMQRAAYGLALAISDFLGGCYGRRVLLLVGSGDNGGDALFAGALLARRGALVSAILLSDRPHAAGLAALRSAGGRIATGPEPADVVVDGIVGIGGVGPLRPDAAALVAALDAVPMVAVDVPSGVGVDTGRVEGPHVRADLTVTFGTHKICHLVDPAAHACGVVSLVDIGLDLPPAEVSALGPDDVAALVPKPGPFAHKYTRGVVGVRAGSARYPGAGVLCVGGADSGLVGMVRYVGGAADQVRQTHPEVVGEGQVQAWVVGSGTDTDAQPHLVDALADGVPVVVDADALSFVRGPLGVPAVLTPHAGELSRLLGIERSEIEADQLAAARSAARRFGAVVLLKGRRTLIAAPDGQVRVTTTGTPWLATAGAGDVLAGLIGALLASGLDPFDAAAVGSWLHGAAATMAGHPLRASDVVASLPQVLSAAISVHLKD